MSNIKAKARQVTPEVSGEGDLDYLKSTKLGALFTADWKQQLILAGLAWSAKVGGITASADILPVVGGGNGTVIDTGQPEFIIGVPSGYYMIVLEASCAVYNIPTSAAITNIVLFADRTMSPVEASVSATLQTPVNLLDGGATFPGTCYSAYTTDITAPICSELLDYVCSQDGGASSAASGGLTSRQIKMDYKPLAPSILAGPCQVELAFGGTAATSGMGVVKVAVVPASYFPIS